ncbi:MAG: hypothetical protein JXX29_16125 [Deltaproteobacteria bacterium]|nr:hypothetical protein [Deltaproteobacteria bacterium]MBN2673210.1 hypothetical protein [Deltaproteobacteria bacterium]
MTQSLYPSHHRIFVRKSPSEAFISGFTPNQHIERFDTEWKRHCSALTDAGYAVVHERSFDPITKRADRIFNDMTSPVCGRILRAVQANVQQEVTNRGEIIHQWRTSAGHHLTLSGVCGSSAKEILVRISNILSDRGYTVGDAARTWFYIRDILAEYERFNRERIDGFTAFDMWRDCDVNTRVLPASTGVGVAGDVPQLQANVYVARNVDRQTLFNAAQKEAWKYGSAFSRGTILTDEGHSLVELSGTAAIDEEGCSMHPDQFEAQMRTTLNKIDALLSPYGWSLEQLSAGCAFVKDAQYLPVYFSTLEQLGLSHLPLIPVVAHICRDDLLFEIDGELMDAQP